jgi:hypothetical protein
MGIDQDQWTAVVIGALVLSCGIGGLVYHFLSRQNTSIYELEEDPEA